MIFETLHQVETVISDFLERPGRLGGFYSKPAVVLLFIPDGDLAKSLVQVSMMPFEVDQKLTDRSDESILPKQTRDGSRANRFRLLHSKSARTWQSRPHAPKGAGEKHTN
jgi:hypothetical protein